MSSRTEKAEKTLRKVRTGNRRNGKPFDGPADLDFIVQETTEGTRDRIVKEFNESTLDKVGEFRGLQ